MTETSQNDKKIKAKDIPDELNFTIASSILTELGERLVGKPDISLAELIKNSYDADATQVDIDMQNDTIIVADNGHGMTLDEFKNFWMRIGTQHKRDEPHSRLLKRPLTGSKGVGRLAAQFIAHKMKLITHAGGQDIGLAADVDWDEAINQGELTSAKAKCSEAEASDLGFPGKSPCGTIIKLSKLKHEWNETELAEVARHIWMLQPPQQVKRKALNFKVNFRSADPGIKERFETQIFAILDIWSALITGELIHSQQKASTSKQEAYLHVNVMFDDGYSEEYDFPYETCLINKLDFTIRIYKLQKRQKMRIGVEDAREYLRKFGNVSIYDANFRLPYYGVDTDWLGIERDHSHRLSISRLLPEDLHVPGGMRDLPTSTRILGTVNIDTGLETTEAKKRSAEGRNIISEFLKIQITRDRLVDNKAYAQLVDMTRTALDYYAMLKAKRKLKESIGDIGSEPVRHKLVKFEKILTQFEREIPANVYSTLESRVKEVIETEEKESEKQKAYWGLLGALATTGIAAISYQHEITRRINIIEGTIIKLDHLLSKITITKESREKIEKTIDELRIELKELSETRAIFLPLLEKSNREEAARFLLKPVIMSVKEQLAPLLKGVEYLAVDITDDFRLPIGRLVEWNAIFQNVFINAYNAMLDTAKKRIRVWTLEKKSYYEIKIEDTGAGVDLKSADKLFEPFERRLKISKERIAQGLGGTGLGLTIVRMIAERLECVVSFVQPSQGYNTCFNLAWKEQS